MKRRLILVIISFCNTLLPCQTNIFNNWYFGDHANITFNTVPPSYTLGSAINSIESCASISDSNGVLLFYSDGVNVYNKNHTQMPNGFGLNGHNSTTQGAYIVPYPKHPKLYYLFTMDAQDGAFGGGACACLSFSIIDMSLLGGLGNVTVKNTLLYTHVTEKMTGYFATDTSIWVVAHEWGSNKFLSYFVSPAGLNTTPITSLIGSSHCCDLGNSNTTGQMKLSQDGTKLGYCLFADNKVELLNFDKTTGMLSNPISFHIPYQHTYGFEFSPNTKYIYVDNSYTLNSNLLQFDISSWDSLLIKNSQKLIDHDNTGTYYQLQLGPDGKIYVCEANEPSLSVINKPNLSGNACAFSPRSVLTANQTRLGLPNVIWGYKNAQQQTANAVDTLCEPLIPNIITPNDDKVNDEFKITCNKQTYIPPDLIIYNRWGQQVFNEAKKINQMNNFPDGTYFYVFSLNDNSYKGFLSVFH